MDTEKCWKIFSVSLCFYLLFLISACGENGTALSTPSLAVLTPTDAFIPTSPSILTPPSSCIDGLIFLEDVTIPDYSIVAPGSTLDKQWLVQNSGSCNWDNRYRLRLVGGDALGSSSEQALFPARVGTTATLQITFIAPLESGEYYSEWQAYDAQGISFGKSFFIKIIVQ